jgi:hypothetical protein
LLETAGSQSAKCKGIDYHYEVLNDAGYKRNELILHQAISNQDRASDAIFIFVRMLFQWSSTKDND